MMRMMNNKTNVKIFSIVIAAIFIIGIGALAYTQMATPSSTGGDSTIGYVDNSRIMTQDNPVFVKLYPKLNEEMQQLQKDTQAKIDAAQDDQTKAKIQMEAQQTAQAKQLEVTKQVQDQTSEAAKAVAQAKGLSVVMDKSNVLYGGVDITDQVLKKLSSDASK